MINCKVQGKKLFSFQFYVLSWILSSETEVSHKNLSQFGMYLGQDLKLGRPEKEEEY
jgi:hypothetical protein